MPDRLRRELYLERGETSRFIDVVIDAAGQLTVSGQDIGKAPLEFWGDSDYEFWVVVEPEHRGRVLQALLRERDPKLPRPDTAGEDELLLALIEERYRGDSRAVDDFKTLLEVHGVPCRFDNWV